MGLYESIQKDFIAARKNQDKFASTVLGMVVSDLKYEKINKQKDLEEADVLSYMQKALKQKRDVIVEFKSAGRDDLVEKETKELDFLAKYLPAMMSEDEITKIVADAVAETGASSPKDMGNLMKAVMPKVKGRADGAMVKNIVTKALNS